MRPITSPKTLMSYRRRERAEGYRKGLDDAIRAALAWADNYPESVFPEDGKTIDSNSASMARHTCKMIALRIGELKAR